MSTNTTPQFEAVLASLSRLCSLLGLDKMPPYSGLD